MSTEMITLSSGATVSLEAVRVGWGLEARGLTFDLDTQGRLHVRPVSRLTAGDDSAIRRHRDDIIEVLRASNGAVS